MEAVGGKWESQSKGEIFSVGKQTCFLQKGIDIETKGDTIDFMEKDPVASLLRPWGLFMITYRRSESPKTLQDMLFPMVVVRVKRKNKQT